MHKLLPVIIVFLLFGCWPPGMDPDKKDGKFLSEVVNLEEFNSEYDDYNSSLPSNRRGETHLIFSSKRDRKDVFNLVYFPAFFEYDKRLELKRGAERAGSDYEQLYVNSGYLISKVNGNFNVFGPTVTSLSHDFVSYGNYKRDLWLFYADDASGDLDIRYAKAGPSDPAPINYLNSPANDAYPTFSKLGDKIYFCSDRAGNFDIYEVTIPRAEKEEITFESLVNPAKYELKKVEELSGAYNDKCPYLRDNMMVFISDRPGGQGGEDIYYSEFVDGKWSAPVNAGPRINTAFNEYRPILPDLSNFNYRLMIYSSNRPGGKGGYDLYMTGLKLLY